jgi:hypothetical protein
MLNNVMKSLVTMLASFALFVGCGESYVSLDGADADKAKGGCEHCEHCESGEDLADKEDDSKDSTKEVDAKNTGEEGTTEVTSATDNSEDASQEEDAKDAGEEDKTTN